MAPSTQRAAFCRRVPTLQEALDLVVKANANGKDVGVFVQVLILLTASSSL